MPFNLAVSRRLHQLPCLLAKLPAHGPWCPDLVDRDAGLARVLFPPLRQRLVHLLQVIVPVRLLRLPVDAQVPGLLHRAQLDALEIEDLREAELRVGLVEVQYLEVRASRRL